MLPNKANARELTTANAAETQTLNLFSLKGFELVQRMSQAYATSTIVPPMYKQNVGNCIIAVQMAARINMDPLMVMQNLYIVNNNPAWSAKFLIAAINASGKFAPLRYEMEGKEKTDNRRCRAWTYDRAGERLCGAWVSIEMAKKEGWDKKSGSKWLTMPEQMLMYRAASFFVRAYAPEISLGLRTADEEEDIHFAKTYATVVDAKTDAQDDFSDDFSEENVDKETGEVLEKEDGSKETDKQDFELENVE